MDELKAIRFNAAQNIFNQIKTHPLAYNTPEWLMANDFGIQIESHFIVYGVLPDIDLYCQAVIDATHALSEKMIDVYWKDTLDGLQEL